MFTFNFTCQRCQEQFNVQFKYMLQKENIVCPNCSNILPETSFCHIKAVAAALKEYGEAEMDRNKMKHFTFTIQ